MSILYSRRRSALISLRRRTLVLVLTLILPPVAGVRTAGAMPYEMVQEVDETSAETPSAPTDRLLAAEGNPWLAELLGEVLQRNTELAALGAFARAVASRPDQVGSFPDPQFAITGYLKTPLTPTTDHRLPENRATG